VGKRLVNVLAVELEPKRLELLRELVPRVAFIAILVNPSTPLAALQVKQLQGAARATGLQLETLRASRQDELDAAFAGYLQRRPDAMVVAADPFFNDRRDRLCPRCPRRCRFLYGGRSRISEPYFIACSKCLQIVHASNLECPTRRWHRQLAKIERRLGGDPRKIAPLKGNARRTFDRLAQRHACYMAKLTEHAQERLRQKMSKRPWPTDPTELRALREACGLPKSY
jgi:hypothetical protein